MDFSFNDASYPRSSYPPADTLSYQNQKPKSLIEAIDSSAPFWFIEELVKQNPDSVHERGFSGLRPLHKAVLLGNQNIVSLLLEYSVELDCRNDFNETPLLLACRQGYVILAHKLIQHGSSLQATDNLGRGAMQFAALGGSVMTMYYLEKVHGLSLDAPDSKDNTLLHVAANQGHADAVMYLLRNQRSELFGRNQGGYTALHCSAQAGHVYISWVLLERGGQQLFRLLTNEGYTATDLARKGSYQSHKDLHKILSYYDKKLKPGDKVTGPLTLWYWNLVAPFFLYMVCLGLSSYINGSIMLLGMLIILVFSAQQGHRINHVCRWGNPMYAGMFAAGLTSTTLCYMVLILPTVMTTSPFLAIFSITYIIAMCFFYAHLLRLDPGVQTQAHIKDTGEEWGILDIVRGLQPIGNFCTACEFIQRPYTKHCKLCQKCHTGMDHHCLFLYKCIAQNNHRQFVRFILVVMLAILVFEYQAVLHLTSLYPGLTHAATDYYWQIVQEQPAIWSTMLANALSFLWGLMLLKFQLQFIALASTQYFQTSGYRSSLTSSQKLRNVTNFLLGRKYYAKDSASGVVLL